MRFAIRDDDTNYFTKPEQLVRAYSKIWDKCPISLSVIPFHAYTKSGGIPEKYWKGNGIFPIGKNKQLVEFLKTKVKEGKVSIMLHGYSHKDNPDGYEFDTGENLYEKVKEGKRYLEEIFGVKIRAFVPPHNTLSKAGLNAVIRNGLNIVNVPPFKPRNRTMGFNIILPFIKVKFFSLRYKKFYPKVLRFGDHKEVFSCCLTPLVSFEDLKSDFDFFCKMKGDFILATHYWEFNAMQEYESMSMGDVFYQFWDYVRQFNEVRFYSVDYLFDSSKQQ